MPAPASRGHGRRRRGRHLQPAPAHDGHHRLAVRAGLDGRPVDACKGIATREVWGPIRSHLTQLTCACGVSIVGLLKYQGTAAGIRLDSRLALSPAQITHR